MVESRAYVHRLPFTKPHLEAFRQELLAPDRMEQRPYLQDYPVVYVIHNQSGSGYEVYVGETLDMVERAGQHHHRGSKDADWEGFVAHDQTQVYVIGHTLFNKSLTLDVENRLAHFLGSIEAVTKVRNRRQNAQNNYYTREHLDTVFSQIWRQLRRHDKVLFPTEQIVRDSALFKASPFHKLNEEQFVAKEEIHAAIKDSLATGRDGQLILVQGEAGAGKTVLLSSLFFELFQGRTSSEDPFSYQDLDAFMLVNHDEQLHVYEEIARKLGLVRKNESRVSKPTRFINKHSIDDKADVVLVDEAHLLWTQGKQSYRGDNMLADLLERAKVVVAVFDPNQVVAGNQYWEPEQLAALVDRADTHIQLRRQMRMRASEETIAWIRKIVDCGIIEPLPRDDYDVRVFTSPHKLHAAIADKDRNQEHGISRLLATYDWAYSSARQPDSGGTWDVEIGDFHLPWNRQLADPRPRRALTRLSWAEQAQTIDEVGSHFTIQGFDLNYAGVILGPSVTYRGGRIVFDRNASANKQVTQQRTLSDGSKADVAETLLRNQLNILLTRGVRGLYLHAVDPPLQAALLEAQKGRA